MIYELLYMLAWWLFIIVAHEFGHAVAFRYYKGRWPVISAWWPAVTMEARFISRRRQRVFLASGVVAGLVVFIVMLNYLSAWVIIPLLLLYLWGCRHDLKELEARV